MEHIIIIPLQWKLNRYEKYLFLSTTDGIIFKAIINQAQFVKHLISHNYTTTAPEAIILGIRALYTSIKSKLYFDGFIFKT